MKQTWIVIAILAMMLTTVNAAVTHEWTFDNWNTNDEVGSITGTPINSPVHETNCLKGECFTFNNYNGMSNGAIQSIVLSALPVPMNSRHDFSVRCAVKSSYDTNMNTYLMNMMDTGGGGGSGFALTTGGLGQTPNGMFALLHYTVYPVSWSRTASVFTEDQWHVVTYTYDEVGPLNKVYVDGVEKTLSDNMVDFNWGGTNYGNYVMFGSYNQNNYNGELSYSGSIDECKFWDTTLSDNEVLTDYNSLTCTPNWQCNRCEKDTCTVWYDNNQCGLTYVGDNSCRIQGAPEELITAKVITTPTTIKETPVKFDILNSVGNFFANIFNFFKR